MHAAAAVAVEDDQVELVELDVEQLADRKGDQRQLADRRAVLLLRRPQDREMDEIDRRIGFEDVAPDALAGMRLAGDQQHPQPVAHAVDDDDGAVVVERQLARAGLDRELEDVGAAMVDRRRSAARRGRPAPSPGCGGPPSLRHGHDAPGPGRAPACRAAVRQILDPDRQLQLLADQAEARRLRDDEPAVALVGQAGEQHVQRRADRSAAALASPAGRRAPGRR